MTELEYLQYYQARQSSFTNKTRPDKFREWLFATRSDVTFPEIRPDAFALEVLQYLAFETVAQVRRVNKLQSRLVLITCSTLLPNHQMELLIQIVDMCLLVKQDQRDSADPVASLMTVRMKNAEHPIFQMKQASSSQNQSAGNESSSCDEASTLETPNKQKAGGAGLMAGSQLSPKSKKRQKVCCALISRSTRQVLILKIRLPFSFLSRSTFAFANRDLNNPFFITCRALHAPLIANYANTTPRLAFVALQNEKG